jgi:hypothetical protein
VGQVITATATDPNNNTSEFSAWVVVTPDLTNHPPAITNDDLTLSAAVINEGGSVSLSGTFRDPDAGQAHTVVIGWGDGSSDTLTLNPGVTQFGPVSHTFRDVDPSPTPSDQYPVTVTVTDSFGASASAATTVTVNNVAPTVQLGPDRTVGEGTPVTLTGSVSDPGPDTFTYLWHVVSSNGQAIADGTSPDFSFTPQDDGVYTVTLTVTDDDGGVGQDDVVVTATNAAPVASVTGPAAGVRGQALAFTLTAADPSPADQAATFTYDLDWDGDGVYEQKVTGPASQPVTHAYAAAGSYTVRVRATDKDGGVSDPVTRLVQVYAGGPAHADITSNFNGTDILAGNTIWFNQVASVSGVDKVNGTTLFYTNVTITFNATTLRLPDSFLT